jgi:hypothetical protein
MKDGYFAEEAIDPDSIEGFDHVENHVAKFEVSLFFLLAVTGGSLGALVTG